jgi:hypothetical protein
MNGLYPRNDMTVWKYSGFIGKRERKMDLRTHKKKYLDSLNLNDEEVKAISLGIDCLIDNDALEEKTPIIVVGGDNFKQKKVMKALETFCNLQYKGNEESFAPRMLQVQGSTTEQACIDLIKQMRCSQGLLYWADYSSWFIKLPDGLFHVITLKNGEVSRGLNQKGRLPERITEEYDDDTLLSELFVNIDHNNDQNISNTTIAMHKFYTECDAGIVRAIPAPKGSEFDETITITSPDWQKLACVALRRYQSRECDCGMSWDLSPDGWHGVVAYPLVEELPTIKKGEIRPCLIGLVTMNIKDSDKPYLSTVWIHPFYRRKRKLSDLWPTLTSRYGQFSIEQPNENMKNFLKSVGHIVD